MQLTPEDKLALSCIKIHPTTTELEQLNSFIPFIPDWEVLTNNLIDRGIGPLLFNKLPQLPNSPLIPSVQRTKLQQTYYKTFSRSTILYEYFRKVIEAFTAGNINVIALKGIYLSEWLYQDIGLRQFSDIDLLVKEGDAGTCLAILSSLGFKPHDSSVTEFIGSKSEIIHYAPMVMEGVSIEIHIKLHRHSEIYHINIEEFWRNARPVNINNTSVLALCDKDLLIHLCVHLDKHFRGGHVQFTCFNDITNLLEKIADTINWDDFIATCRIHQCEDTVLMYIILVNKYINATVPVYIIDNYSYLLTEENEILFIKYLNGHVGTFSAVPVHLGNLKNLTSLSDKLWYLLDLVFPPKAFMIQKYKINHPGLYMFYYPYRWWVGLKGVISLVGRK